MNRSAGVTVVAVFAMLGSLAILLLGCVMIFVAVFVRNSAASTPQSRGAAMLASSMALFLPALWGIATSIGLFFLKRWSRISILVFAGLLAFTGLGAPLIFFAMQMPPTVNQDPQFWASVKIAMSGTYLLLASIGVWWLVYFTRPSVRAQFQTGSSPGPASSRPLSISIIGWLLLLGSVTTVFSALFRFPAAFFNQVLTGWTAVLLDIVFAGLALYLGLGLLRLNPRARVLAIYFSVFGTANAVLFYVLPGADQRFSAMMNAMPFFRPRPPGTVPSLSPWFTIVLTGGFMVAQVYFLVTRKPAFYRDTPSSEIGPTSESIVV
jgi:hypothetical protein